MNRVFLLLGLLLFACSRSEEPTPTATQPSLPTPTLARVVASPTSLPAATTAPPTVTPAPPAATPTSPAAATVAPAASATPAPDAERIVFASGATAATVSGTVGPVESDRYLLRALADQMMMVRVTPAGSETMLLAIQGADGTLLKRDAVGGPTWSGLLPASQDYELTVRTAGEAGAEYTLVVEVSPLAGAPAPERITFAPGATAATVAGSLAAQGDVAQYLLAAQAGQRLVATVTAEPAGMVLYSLRDGAGATMVTGNAPTPLVSFLPETGDYLLTLTTHNIAPAVTYTLTVEISSAGPLPEPERITFGASSTGEIVSGTIPSGGSERYILRALGGQTMQLDVTADPAGALTILVQTESGSFLTAGDDGVPLSLTLPATQDYVILLMTPFAAPAVSYQMAITIH